MTWSIAARDASTGSLGIAVSSRFFAVGALVPWIRSGVGAVCTQALINPNFGPRALQLLECGVPPAVAVRALVEGESSPGGRQLHLVSASGEIAAFTGPECVDWAGHRSAEGVSVAGNMLAGPATVEATLEGYLDAAGKPFAERLLRGLMAGERAGGDKRGKQAAAVLVFGAEIYPDLDIRVDDHPEPIAELFRLYGVAHRRSLGFASGMPTRANPAGIADREVLERRIEAWIAEHGQPEFREFWERDPWR